MLIRLGRWLRLVGNDVANPGGTDDPELMVWAMQKNRILLTRDMRLYESCKITGVECILIKSTSLIGQLKEMAMAGVNMELKPQRCTVCNGALREVAKTVANGTRCQPSENRTWECEGCGKLYWPGSHWTRIEDTLRKVRSEKG
jgi:uncharacterized protein with PIN domain